MENMTAPPPIQDGRLPLTVSPPLHVGARCLLKECHNYVHFGLSSIPFLLGVFPYPLYEM